jgi:hypothetical protein
MSVAQHPCLGIRVRVVMRCGAGKHEDGGPECPCRPQGSVRWCPCAGHVRCLVPVRILAVGQPDAVSGTVVYHRCVARGPSQSRMRRYLLVGRF